MPEDPLQRVRQRVWSAGALHAKAEVQSLHSVLSRNLVFLCYQFLEITPQGTLTGSFQEL